MKNIFKRYCQNPILSPEANNPWEALTVCNPAAWYENNTFYLLYRGAGNDNEHKIQIGLATSRDGYHFIRHEKNPVLQPTLDNFDEGCCEDPRIVKYGDTFYLTYAFRPFAPGRYWENGHALKSGWEADEFAPNGLKWNITNTGLAVSKDLIHFRKLGRITPYNIDNRDVILFPRKIEDKYVRLERPMDYVGPSYGCDSPSIWINFSDNLMEWPKPTLLAIGEEDWEKKKLGGSTPPLETPYGWLVFYHGVSNVDSLYRVGVILLDLKQPTKIISRSKDFLMEPEMTYETEGFYSGCVFPTGIILKNDTIFMYYGGADRFVNLATASLSELLNNLIKSN
ncbi:MAG: glycosidase [Bacilli bacterium]|nr:glycosidase [Bacilli bacterium]